MIPNIPLIFTPILAVGGELWYNICMKGTQKALWNEILTLLRKWKSQGQTDLVKAHVERYRKMGWHFKV